MLLTAS